MGEKKGEEVRGDDGEDGEGVEGMEERESRDERKIKEVGRVKVFSSRRGVL